MKVAIIVMAFILIALLIPSAFFSPWIYFSYKVKNQYENTFAIQNVGTGKDLRVLNVGVNNETPIILYPHHEWECLTWQFIQLNDSTYMFKNLATQKTFEPSANPSEGVFIWQKSLGGSRFQFWEIIKQTDDSYRIRLNNSDLYLTAISEEDNSRIVLTSFKDDPMQEWKLIKQNPIYR